MRVTLSGVSERQSCRVLAVGRASLHRSPTGRRRPVAGDPPWVEPLWQLIQQHPTFGYRHLWAVLRRQMPHRVNKKAVYQVLRQKRWLVHQRSCTPRPRGRGRVSQASRSNERWAMDVTHIPCGRDGGAHLATVIDCHDREIVGYDRVTESGEGSRVRRRSRLSSALLHAPAS